MIDLTTTTTTTPNQPVFNRQYVQPPMRTAPPTQFTQQTQGNVQNNQRIGNNAVFVQQPGGVVYTQGMPQGIPIARTMPGVPMQQFPQFYTQVNPNQKPVYTVVQRAPGAPQGQYQMQMAPGQIPQAQQTQQQFKQQPQKKK
jgi:hypothetical protein